MWSFDTCSMSSYADFYHLNEAGKCTLRNSEPYRFQQIGFRAFDMDEEDLAERSCLYFVGEDGDALMQLARENLALQRELDLLHDEVCV